MKVFNLTSSPVDYRGKVIPPFGKTDFPKLTNLTERDNKLKGVLSFGSLPPGWSPPSHKETVPVFVGKMPERVDVKIIPQQKLEIPLEPLPKEVPEAKPEDVVEVSERKDFNNKKKRY